MRRSLGVTLLALCCSASWSCSDESPTAPGGALALRPGVQLLSLNGYAVSIDPTLPPCTPPGVPRDGTSVDTFVMLSAEGRDWVARSTSGDGSIELRLREDGSSPLGVSVVGSIGGSAPDVPLFGLRRDVRVTLEGTGGVSTATLDGTTASPISAFVAGRIRGAIRFSDSHGGFTSCSVIEWTMQPY